MRKVSGLQVLCFLLLLTTAAILGLCANYILFGALPLGDFRGVFLTASAIVLVFISVIAEAA